MPIYTLKGKIQHYAWGGKEFLPKLLGIDNPECQPFAELWMGTHHRGEAIVQQGDTQMPLSDFIEKNPVSVLGQPTATRFANKLPFLFKVLAVDKMLSIQSHPTRAQAIAGFESETKAGVPLTATHRNFKDNNHKPEVMVALTDFWLLHGFKSVAAIEEILYKYAAFAPLRKVFSNRNIFELYKYIMELPQQTVNEWLKPLAQILAKGIYTRDEADYWAKLAFEDYTRDNGDYDRGIFSIYLFNLVRLSRGEGIYQGAGIPHAYLEGVNVELMANSDNVFRGGLTPKYVDVPQLLHHLVVEPVTPMILHGQPLSDTERVFRTPAPDFELRQITLDTAATHTNAKENAPAIIVVMEGQISVTTTDIQLTLTQGEIAFITANTDYVIRRKSHSAVLFKAIVPV